MSAARLFRLLFCACVALLGVRSRGADPWLTAHTPHFEMFTNDSEKESRRILFALEQFRANFLASFPFRGAAEPRTAIILFNRDSQFDPYKPLYEGKPKAVAGYFMPGEDEVVIAMTTDLRGEDTDPTEVIYHEYIHLLLNARKLRVPVWFNEGLAELYSTFRVDGDKVTFGDPKDQHVAVLSRSSMLPLARLFAVNHDSPDYNEEQRVGQFYAQSWALTHYLVCGADRSNGPKLANFIKRLGNGSVDTEAAFRAAFGTDYHPMELALRSYLDGGKYFKRTDPALFPGLEIKFKPAADIERDLALLNLKWRIHRPADTAYRVNQLLRDHPDQPRAYELLAAIAMSQGELETAQAHWSRAAHLGSDNPFVYVQLMRAAIADFQGAAFLTARLPPERIGELRHWADVALTLNPEDADALEASALIETLSAEFSIPAINRVQARVLGMREPARTLLALAIVRWRSGDPATARDIVGLILEQRRADMPTRAAAELLRSRLPGGDEVTDNGIRTAATIDPKLLASRAAVSLQNGRPPAAAAVLLDRLIMERGSLAPRMKLDPVVVTVAKDALPEKSPWAVMDETRRRAAAGNAEAMFDLALAHAWGTGVEFSPELAAAWLEKAASAGQATALIGRRKDPGETEAACEFLRMQRPLAAGETRPPLDRDLAQQIAVAVAAGLARPLAFAYRATPRYPEKLWRAGLGGEALAQFRISAAGQPQSVAVVQANDPAVAAAAEECVRQCRFLPVIRDGRPVATLVELPIRFQITAAPAAAK